MKKFTLIALALLMTLGASAQRKTWDFTKGFSTATIAALEASYQAGKVWTDYEKESSKGTGKYYINLNGVISGTACTYDADGNATPIPEFEGMDFKSVKKKGFVIAYNYDQKTDEKYADFPNSIYPYGKSFLWFNGKDQSFTIKTPANTTLKMGVESHKDEEVRGWNVIVDGNTLSAKSGNNIPISFNEVTYDLPAASDGTDSLTVTIKSTNGAHLYYLIVGEGDEPAVEENKKIGFVYGGESADDDLANRFIAGAGNYDVTNISASSTVTLDSLQKFDAVVIANNVAADAALVPTLKTAVAYEPVVNLNSKLYSAWGYGSEVAGENGNITIAKTNATLFSNWDSFDPEAPELTILNEGNVNGVSLGDYFAADDTLATTGSAVAIHQHNPLRNTYIFLPFTADLSTADGDIFSGLLLAAVKTAADTKTEVTHATKPSIKEEYKDQLTTVTLSAQKGATIYYTIDGTDPTTASTVYTEPFDATTAITVKALATLDGYLQSDVTSKTITIKTQAKAPTFSVDQQDGKSVVTINKSDEGVSIYYNFSGSSEQTASQVYTEPVELTQKATITAFVAGGDFVQSESASQLVEIQGQTEDNVRTYLLTNGHYNTADWYDGSKAVYPFSWGKSAKSIYKDAETKELNDYEVAADTLGWKVISRGQVVTFENTAPGTAVGDGNGYNPATALDALAIETSNGFGNVEPTKCETTLGAKAEGEPYTAAIQSTQAYQGPFDVVTYCYNGNGSSDPEIAVLISTDGENFTVLGDTLVMNQARRLYRRSVVSYDGTDKVYVRVAHVGGGSKAMLSDIYVLGNKSNEAVASGINKVITDNTESANAKVAAIYSINGTQLREMQHGINIVKYSDGSVRKVLVK